MMRRLVEGMSRLRALVRQRAMDRDFDEELAAHIDLLAERNERRGLSPIEARRQAILQIGGVRPTRDLHREARGLPRLESILQAFSHAGRSWRHAPTVAVLAAAALGVGIGSATAIYTVVNAVLLKPLPYRDGAQWIALFEADATDGARLGRLTSQHAQKYQDRVTAFDAFGWYREAGKNLMFGDQPDAVSGAMVTLSLVPHLGVDPVIGHWFRDEAGAVISTSLWRRLGSDPGVIGKGLTLDGRRYTITGVMPESFHLPVAGVTSSGLRTDVWMALNPNERAGAAYVAYARRRPGIPLAAAEADVNRVALQIAAEDPPDGTQRVPRLFDLRETVIRDIRPTLLLLFAASGLLLLIACATAAWLLLSQSVTRARETATRVALGANRAQLAVQYLAEGLLIAMIGAAFGVVLSVVLTPRIVSMAAGYLPRADEIAVDWAVLLFALLSAVIATLLSSIAPLRYATRTMPADVLNEGLRATASSRTRRVSHGLVVAEIAFAFALLASSAVMIEHLRSLSRTSLGFDPDNVVTFSAGLPGAIANDASRRIPVQRRFMDSLATIPGVDAVGFSNQLPLKGCCWRTSIYAEDHPLNHSANDRNNLMAVSEGYFRAMRIQLRSGRFFSAGDALTNTSAIPVVVSQAAATRYWATQDPLGTYGRLDEPDGPRFHVIGIAADVRNDALNNPTVPEIYMPAYATRVEGMRFVVRSERPIESLLPDIRRAIRTVDPELPMVDVATMRDVIGRTVTLERVASRVTAFFAASALLMALLGVYGVVAYSIRQRRVEIGMRMALGATSRGVLALVVGSGLKMAAYGVLAGAAAAFGGATYLGRAFDIGEIGPVPFLYSTAIVVAVACAASFIPAWRATMMSPIAAIRNGP
jgi:putative ABC transport system permease protein